MFLSSFLHLFDVAGLCHERKRSKPLAEGKGEAAGVLIGSVFRVAVKPDDFSYRVALPFSFFDGLALALSRLGRRKPSPFAEATEDREGSSSLFRSEVMLLRQ